jgi:Signal transduction histidine kinase
MIDLAMHMMDIVQNSIRAKAQNIEIDLFENNDDATLLFRVKDDGQGMNDDAVKKLTDPFFTTRTTRRVGLGVPFLKMTCEQSGGSLRVESEEGAGTTIEGVYRTDNLDCLPLGDIAGCIALLLRANPDKNFRFTYRMDELLFTLDSGELKEQGIDLQQAHMLGVMKAFIRENLDELYKHRSFWSYLC